MFKNYFITAIRNLRKDKLNTIINIIGLSLGIACCILILLFVQNELSFDKFHSKSDNIYRAWVLEDYTNGQQFFNTVTPFPLASALKNELPEVKSVVQISLLNWKAVIGDKKYEESVNMVGSDFFNVFDFKIVSGNLTEVLSDVKNIVITESKAIKFFGNTDVVGKTITFDLDGEQKNYEIKAVVQDPPSNSSIQFSLLISDLNKTTIFQPFEMENWFNVNPETYVLLNDESNLTNIDKKLKEISKKYVEIDEGTYKIGLQPLTDIHLNPDFPVGIAKVSDPKYSFILAGIAILILIIACINFIMLSISKSVKRTKEVGVRKAVGASRIQIIQQFLSEAVVMVFIGLLVGLLLAFLFLPSFNDLANKQLSLNITLYLILVSVGLVFVIGIVAGSYPAFVISNLKTTAIIKGDTIGFGRKNKLRKVLIGIQFVLSIGLISSTLIMREQLNFLKNKNLGFNKEQLVMIPLNIPEGRLNTTINKGLEIAEIFKSKLKNYSEIKNVSAASHAFTGSGWTEIGYSDIDGKYQEFNLNVVSPEYLKTMEMEIIEGRDFQENNISDKNRAIIINEAFAKAFNINNLNNSIIPSSPFGDHEIVGIVRDFNYASLHGKVKPMVLSLNPSIFFVGNININIFSDPTPKLFVRLEANKLNEGIANINKVWNEIVADETFEYQFVDEQINAIYTQEENLGKIVGIAALLVIIIGSLGLFALASLNIQSRMKELSIRKILGASKQIILYLISKEYALMILITLCIAAPISWYIMNNWLSSFEYRIHIGVLFFLLAGCTVLIASIFSIGYHAYKAMNTQPVEYLRNE